MSRGVFILGLLLLLGSCKQEKAPLNQAAFYHWKANLELGSAEREALEQLQANRLYLRLFDLDWDAELGMPVPVGETVPGSWQAWQGEVHPTVFITNRSLEQLPPERIPWLADQLIRRMDRAIDEAGDPLRVGGWQIDCDWTEGTRDAYFQLLQLLNDTLQVRHLELSATIRLHQVKYFERTGVPPVHRGMLMAYNIGVVKDTATTNSILELDVLESYLGRMGEYPLALDLALPIFSWGVLFREDRLIRLINLLSATDLADTSRFQQVDANLFEVKRNTYLWGYYLYSDDQIRLESVSPGLLLEAAARLNSAMKREHRHLSFYHLDPTLLQSFTYETLQSALDTLR